MMIREKSKCIKHKDESTNARHRGGRIRSSDEVSVIETERRGSVIYTFEIGQPIMGGANEQKKPYEISKQQVMEAYKGVKANKGAAGVDRTSIEEFEANLKNNLYKLWNRMSSGSYFPMPVKGVEIPKKNGGKRLLGVPAVVDRVAQMIVVMNLEPLLEPLFYDDSYGYRPNKSAIDAVGITRERCWEYNWLIEFDIKGLFDNIDHELLMKAVGKHTDCKWMLLYIERWLKVPFLMPNGELIERTAGTPQGSLC